MGIRSKVSIIIASLQLLHAGFSSYEFHQLLKGHMHKEASKAIRLPIDIHLEVFSGLVLFLIGILLSFDKLSFYTLNVEEGMKPITEDQYLHEIQLHRATNADNIRGVDPAGEVSYTPTFVDIHQKRRQMREWVIKNSK